MAIRTLTSHLKNWAFLFLGATIGWWGHAGFMGNRAEPAVAGEPIRDEAAAEAAPVVEPSSTPDVPPGVTDPAALARWELLRERDLEAALHPAPDWPTAESEARNGPRLRARAWYVYDHDSGKVLTSHLGDVPQPVASITKLAAALVWADSGVPDDAEIELLQEDKDFIQVTRSRLRVGASYRAIDLLHSSLLSSDNRATAALMRSTGLGREGFAAAMNRRMDMLGLATAHFGDPTGLDEQDVASPRDVARLMDAALAHPRVAPVLQKREHRYQRLDRPVFLTTRSSNRLTHQVEWGVVASKTGYTDAAGSCLVMRAWVEGHPVTIAMTGARGVRSRYGDAVRLRQWIGEQIEPAPVVAGLDPKAGLFRPWPGDGLLPSRAMELLGDEDPDHTDGEDGAGEPEVEDEFGGP
jgi:D-alanyl-D-alanine endopeptidase (penicillin-binding protein 7)